MITKAHSRKLLFEGKKCVGVEYFHKGKVKEVRVDREVICCAGAFGTPHLLQLSGIGPAALLQKQGIEVVHDLPGVGQNLQDHPDYIAAYKANSTDLMGYSLKGFMKMLGQMWQYKTKKTGLFASTVAESGGFLKTDPALDRPDLQLHFVSGIADNHNGTSHWGHGFSCHVCVLRPKSVGSVEIASRDPMQDPLIDPALLAHDDDMTTLIKGYKVMQEIMKSPPLARHVTEVLYKPHLSDEAEIEDEIRSRADTVYHPVGTAKMGTDTMAVVSPKDLMVYGVEGLRVADASIMPTLIGGNTNAPAIMIGEKASDMILGK